MISEFWTFGLQNLFVRTREPFFSNLRTFELKNLRTQEPSNLRTFGLMGCNRGLHQRGVTSCRLPSVINSLHVVAVFRVPFMTILFPVLIFYDVGLLTSFRVCPYYVLASSAYYILVSERTLSKGDCSTRSNTHNSLFTHIFYTIFLAP